MINVDSMINVDEFSADTFQNFGGLNELLILVQKNMGENIWVFPKIGKMDGENNGKPRCFRWMIWGEKTHYFRKHPNLLQIQAISEGVQEPNSGASLCLDPARPDPEGYDGYGG